MVILDLIKLGISISLVKLALNIIKHHLNKLYYKNLQTGGGRVWGTFGTALEMQMRKIPTKNIKKEKKTLQTGNIMHCNKSDPKTIHLSELL